MRLGSKTSLMIGLVIALGIGMWAGNVTIDRLKQRQAAAPATQASAPEAAPEVAKKPAVTRRAARTTTPRVEKPAPEPVAEVSTVAVSSPDLQDRLRKVLFRGTKVELAAEGFRDGLQFATFAHASRNTMIPLVLLKHRAFNEGKSLEQAIRESKPEMNAEAEAARAREMAQADIEAIGN